MNSEFLMGKRLEYVVLEQNLVTEQSYFQDASRNLSLDYFEGTSEVLTKMKKNVMKFRRSAVTWSYRERGDWARRCG